MACYSSIAMAKRVRQSQMALAAVERLTTVSRQRFVEERTAVVPEWVSAYIGQQDCRNTDKTLELGSFAATTFHDIINGNISADMRFSSRTA